MYIQIRNIKGKSVGLVNFGQSMVNLNSINLERDAPPSRFSKVLRMRYFYEYRMVNSKCTPPRLLIYTQLMATYTLNL